MRPNSNALKAQISKALGLDRSLIRVTTDGALRVTVDALVDLAEVESICKAFESVSRDAYTGEILSGGNYFVTVRYGDKWTVTAAMVGIASWRARAERAEHALEGIRALLKT